jgi:hypothetical protein
MDPAHETSQDSRKLEGRYSNYFKVGHNAFEFVIDFGQFYSESKEAHLHTRIITSPVYIKSLLETLQDSIEQYEKAFGAIQERDSEEKTEPD